LLIACLLLRSVFAFAAPAPARIPLHWLWHEQETDSAYTVSAERRELLLRRGYVDMGAIAYVDAQPISHARLLKCFYSPAPRTNTFCSASAIEQRVIRALGYEQVSTEGYVQHERAADSLVLYRLSRAYGNDAKDREHRFVTSGDEVLRLRKQGWTYDGSKGFVYGSP
jgi:hypothetical protein